MKLAIFDFDGTLVDTLTDVALTFNAVLEGFGYPTHPVEDYERFVGGNLEQVIGRMLPKDRCGEADITRVKEAYRLAYATAKKPNTRPYPGIRAHLEALKNMEVRLAINTNKAQALIEPMAAQHFGDIPFVGICGYREDFPPKPAPDGVFELMGLAGANAEETVYIGDGESDILTAQNADIPLWFVTWGQGSAVDLADKRIAFVAKKAEDLTACAKEWMGR